MDVTKAPPSNEITGLSVGTANNPAAATQSQATAGVSTAPTVATTVAATADRVDIQPLDVAAALQILIAEVRAELPLLNAILTEVTPLPGPVAALQAAEGALSDLPETGTPPPASTDAAASQAPSSESGGLALLESQAMPSPGVPELSAGMPRPGVPESSAETAPGDAATGGGIGARPVELPLPEPLFPLVPPGLGLPGIARPGPEPPAMVAPWTGPGPPLTGPPSVAAPPLGGSPGKAPPATELPSTGPAPTEEPPWTESPWTGSPLAGSPGGDDGGMGEGMTPIPLPGRWLSPTSLPGLSAGLDGDLAEPLMAPNTRFAMPSALTLMSSPAQASPVLMRLFLQAVPREVGNPAVWSATVLQLEGTLQSALDRAVATVEQWHDVPQAVVDAVRETRGLVMSQLGDEALGPVWLRPEWMWFSPQMERFRRRRRLARRGLSDPDLWPLREEDGRDEKPAERKDDR